MATPNLFSKVADALTGPKSMRGVKGSIMLDPDAEPPAGYELVGMSKGKRVYQPVGEVYGGKTREQYQAEARPLAEQAQTRAPKKMYGERTIAREEAARQAARQRALSRAETRAQDLAALKEREAAYKAEALPKPGAATFDQYEALKYAMGPLSKEETDYLSMGVIPPRIAEKMGRKDADRLAREVATSKGIEEVTATVRGLGLGRGQQVVPAAQRSLLDRLLGRNR